MKRRHLALFALAVSSLSGLASAADEHGQLAVAQAAFRDVILTGFTRARALLPLVAETSGKVLEVTADIGGTIGEHGVFARLDSTFIRLELNANRVQQKQLRSHIEYDLRETKRYRALAAKGSASKSHLDELEQTLRDNRYRLEELTVQDQILEERLQRTQVRAPLGWRVTQRRIEPGQLVKEGDVLGEVSDFSQLLVPFALSPQQFIAMRQQQDKLSILLTDWEQEIPAKVFRINPRFDQETRKIAVELVLGGDLPERRGGLRTCLVLPVPERTGAVTLPSGAVSQSYEEYWVIREDGERITVVKLGGNNGPQGDLVRIASPRIKPGDRFRLVENSDDHRRAPGGAPPP